MPTTVERIKRYFEGIYEGDSLYDATDRVDVLVPNPGHHTSTRTSDTEGTTVGTYDTDVFESEGGGGTPMRHRRVRFLTSSN